MSTIGTTPAKFDANRVPTILALSGTIDATYGTAVPIPLTATDDGKLNVNASVTAGETDGGTLDLISVIADIQDGAGDSIMDASNDAMKVNVVAGGAGGGAAQLQVRNAADDGWEDVGFATTGDGTFNVPVHLRGGGYLDSIIDGTLAEVTSVGGLPDLPGGTLDEITNIAGGTVATESQHTVDAALGSVPTGNLMVGKRDEALTATGQADGDAVEARIDNYGALWTNQENASIAPGDAAVNTNSHITTSGNNALYQLTRPSVFNGTSWDRLRGDTTNGIDVDVTRLVDVPGGTVDLLTDGTVQVKGGSIVATGGYLDSIVDGTLAEVTTVPTVSNVTNLDAGTITEIGALPDLPGGTIDSLSALPDLPGGTVDVVSSVANLAGGTVQVDPLNTRTYVSYGTTIANGSEATILSAPGAGTAHYIQNISVVIHGTASASAYVGWGTADAQGTPSLVRGEFAGNGGVEKQFPYNIAATNTALNGSVSAGSISVNLTYFTA